MAIKINFDAAGNPETPTFVLAKRNGEKMGQIPAKEISVSDSLNDAPEISFTVYKTLDGVECPIWDEITNFKLVYCVEWNAWFEITVELDESNDIMKTVFGTELEHAELGQIMLYTIEINTENDITRDDYKEPTVLFNETNPEISLLNRIMEKAPHYEITHVDSSIAPIQRTFSFDDISLYDAFQDIAEEIQCIFILQAKSDENGKLRRTVEVYDLLPHCKECDYRGESVSDYVGFCPDCAAEDVETQLEEGYGEDTTIFVTSDELADSIGLTTDTDAVKNCFKLEAGDDLMTATIRNCNPNGTDYLWYFSDDMKHDMPVELVDKIESYDEVYDYYQNDHIVMETANDALTKYNELVKKYQAFRKDLETVDVPIKGYPALMNAYYNTIDMNLYLTSSMMPSPETMETDAKKEAEKLTTDNLSPVAVQNLDIISNVTADNAVLAMARLVVDTRFKVKITTSTVVKATERVTWTGSFEVTNYYDDEDVANANDVVVVINDNYVEFVRQKVDKQLSRDTDNEVDIVGLFALDQAEFVNELRKYSLNRLKSFHTACQAAIDILIEQGIADKETWSGGETNLYDDLYLPYMRKLEAINTELKLREEEIQVVVGKQDADGDYVVKGLQNYLDDYRDEIQEALDFEKYLGEDMWHDFCAYRREDKYTNDNYISDALDNGQLFDKAQEFLERATEEIHKSAEQQHSISSDLKNLLVIDRFKPLVEHFSVGNWLRAMVDNKVYKLRLIQYEIDYDNIEEISVDFSDVIKSKDSASDVQDILDQAQSMATSYESIKHQAEQGADGNDKLTGWVNEGLSLTNIAIVGDAENQNFVLGPTGLLAREYLPITDTYDDRQLKIINRGLYVTDDDWMTARAGIGNFLFWNPKTKEYESAYGVIADTIVGNVILSEEVGIYNKNNSITMDEDGFCITTNADGDINQNIFTIQKEVKDSAGVSTIEKLLYVDENGNLNINGGVYINNSSSSKVTIEDATNPDNIITETNSIIQSLRIDIDGLESSYATTSETISNLGIRTESLESDIKQIPGQITAEVTSLKNDIEANYYDRAYIDLLPGQITSSVETSISDNYYSKTEINQLPDQLRITIENDLIETYLRFDPYTGLTVGKEGEISSVRMSNDGEFQVLRGNYTKMVIGDNIQFYNDSGDLLFTISAGETQNDQTLIIQGASTWHDGFTIVNGDNKFTGGSDGYSFSSWRNGFSVGSVSAVEVARYVFNSTGECNADISGLVDPDNVEYVVIYYRIRESDSSTFGNNANYSLKVPLQRGSTVRTHLNGMGVQSGAVYLFGEYIYVTLSGDTLTISRNVNGMRVRCGLTGNGVGINNSIASVFQIDYVTVCA